MEAIEEDIRRFLSAHPGVSARLHTDPPELLHVEFDNLLSLFDTWEALLDDPHWARHDVALVVDGHSLWFDYRGREGRGEELDSTFD
jgi:hypothetical protein